MSKIKLSLLLTIICLGLTTSMVAFAQEDSTIGTYEGEIIQEVLIDESVSAEGLGVKEPTLLPDSPFYFLKNWGRGIRSFFTIGKVKKAELESRYANERLIEIKN